MKDYSNERIFLAVVEMGSFKAAAEGLGTEPSSISRRVSNLEARLKTKLLNRSTKKSTLTEAGERYYEGIRRLLDEQLALENEISGVKDKAVGTLKVAAPHDFGTFFVAPVLEKLVKKNPALSVELLLSSQYENLISQGIDVAIRIGKLPDSSLICRRIGDVPRVLVASKKYLKQYGVPKKPVDLECHRFIYYTKAHASQNLRFASEAGAIEVATKGSFIVNSVTAIRELVLTGHGIHLGPRWAFQKELNEGKLISLLNDFPQDSYPLHALYISKAFVPAKIRFFIDLLSEKFKSFSL